jgi:hypothetical protein
LQRQFPHVGQRIAFFKNFAGHFDRVDERILEKLVARLARQVLVGRSKVVSQPETVAGIERGVT